MIFNELPEEVDDFLNYLENIKGKSKNTVTAYKSDLKLFFRFLKLHLKLIKIDDLSEFEKIDISDINIEIIQKIKLRDLYAFLNFVDKERKNSSYAKARKVATLKSFFKFLHSKLKIIKNNPADELESPKIEKRHPIYLDLNESLEFLQTLDKNSKNYIRDYCIITLFLNCGLRLSELCNIDVQKINGDTLSVIGKGNKERTVYLNNSCIEAIENYMQIRDSSKVEIVNQGYLFISQHNKPLNKRSVELLVKKHIKNSNINTKKITPHKLRHTAATLMYKYGEVDIRALQSILGHENVSTTQIYTHVDDEQLRKAASSNPLSNIKTKK
ncbi:MAG: tyrosine recombinase XerC [Sarcina sp.]